MKAGFVKDLRTIYNLSGLTGVLYEAQKVQVNLAGTPIGTERILNFANAAANTVLFSGFDDGTKINITGFLPQATSLTGGIVKLAQDFGGTSALPKVVGVRGFSVSADPAGTNLLLATDNVDGSSLTWMVAGSSAGTYCYGADTRLTNSRIPSGLALGDLSGSYPSPTVTGLKGNPLPTSFAAGTFLQWNTGNNGWSAIAYGQAGNTIASGNDPRFTDSRTPTAHASSHQHLGSDEIASSARGASLIPKANLSGYLYSGWGGFSGSLATLNANTRVVEPVTVLYDGVSTNIPISSIAEAGLLLRNGGVIITVPSIGTYVLEGDSRLSDARIPSGLAAGDLSGSYPSPTVTGLKSKPLPQSFAAGTFLQWNTSNNGWAAIAYGQSANTIASGNDPRFTNSRNPTTHASGHNSTGNDPLYLKDVSKIQTEYYLRDDFQTLTDWGQSTANGGSAYNTESQYLSLIDRNHPGVARINQGATSGAYVHLYLNNLAACLLGTGHQLEFLFSVVNTGYRCTGRLGFGDGIAGADHTDGAYIEIDCSTSTNYRYCTASGGLRTKATSTKAITQSVWHTGLIDFYSPTGIKYYVDGTLLGSLSGTIPTGIKSDTTIQFFAIGGVANGFFGVDVDVVEHRALIRR